MVKGIKFLVGIVFVVTLASFVIASHLITTSIGSTSYNVNEDVGFIYNITVNNTDTLVTGNITQVNISIPSSFTFIANSNGTNAGTHTFSNTTTILTWNNSDSLVMNLTWQEFWFNATALTPGDYNLTITTLNATGAYSSNISVTVNDTTVPEVSASNFSSPLTGSNYSGVIVLNVSLVDNGVLSAVYFNVTNSTGVQTNFVSSSNPSGSVWNTTLNTSALSDGVYNVTAYTNDTYNNQNNSAHVYSVTFDNTAPSIVFNESNPSNNANFSTLNSTVINVTFSDATAGIETVTFLVYNSTSQFNSTSFSDSGVTHTLNLTSLPDGVYTYNVTVNDSSGNSNVTATRTFRVDTAVPIVAEANFSSPLTGSNYSGVIVLNVSVTDATLGVFSVYFNVTNSTGVQTNFVSSSNPSGSVWNTTLNTGALSDGVYNITVYANDSQNNLNNSAHVYSLTFDNTAPSIVFNESSPLDNVNFSTLNSTVINVTFSDTTAGIETVTFLVYNSTSQFNSTSFSDFGVTHTLNLTSLPDGTYTYNVTVNDSSGNSNVTATRTFRVDVSTAPNVSLPLSPLSSTSYSGLLLLNVTISDIGGMSGVFFNVTNWSGIQNATYTASNIGNWWNATLNTSNFPEGLYNITVWANDTNGNINNSVVVFGITFDNTAPTITLTSSSATKTSLTLTISGGQGSCSANRGGASISGSTLTESSLSCGTSYPYVVTCTDLAGNAGSSASTSFSTSACSDGGSSSGGGASTFWVNTYNPTEEQLDVGYIKSLGVKNRVRIKVNKEIHYVGVKELIGTNGAIIEIASTPMQSTLNVGDEFKFDVNNDGFYDLYVKLNSITDKKADLTIKKIFEVVLEEKEEEKGESESSSIKENLNGEEIADKDSKINFFLIALLFILGMLIVFGALFIKKKRRRK